MNAHEYYFKDFQLHFDEWLNEQLEDVKDDILLESITGEKLSINVLNAIVNSQYYHSILNFYKSKILPLNTSDDYEYINENIMRIDTGNLRYADIISNDDYNMAMRINTLYERHTDALIQACEHYAESITKGGLYVFKDGSELKIITKGVVL